jgi:hypothetical protein
MRPELHIVPPVSAPFEGKSTIVERGPYRVIVGEHPYEVYLAVGNGSGAKAMFCDPRTALDIAAALIAAAGKAVERQFQRQMGGP